MLWRARKAEDWDTIPQRLGMTVDGYGVLQGRWSGVPLRAHHRTETVTSRDDEGRITESEQWFTYYTATFDPPLHMALSVSVAGAFGRFATWLGKQPEGAIGEPAFDAAFRVSARDPAHARRVLSGVPAQALLAAREKHSHIEANDSAVTITAGGWIKDFEAVRHALECVGRVAGAIQWERRAAPAAWESDVRRAWPAQLGALGLSFDPTRFEGQGFVDRLYVRVRLHSESEPLGVVVSVQAATPYARELRITRQHPGRIAGWFRGQDIEVGDAVFDESFVVKGEDEPAIRALLQGEPAARLTALLAGASDLCVENDTLTVHGREIETDRLGAMITACIEAARAIRARG